jgi:hypothetical protein
VNRDEKSVACSQRNLPVGDKGVRLRYANIDEFFANTEVGQLVDESESRSLAVTTLKAF